MNRYILSLAAIAMVAAGCQKDDIVDTDIVGSTNKGESTAVGTQIVISGSVGDLTRGSVTDTDDAFKYVWDAEYQFLLDIDGVEFSYTDGESIQTEEYSPTTLAVIDGGAGVTLISSYGVAESVTSIDAGTKVVSMGPLSAITVEADGSYTATMPTEFETGSDISRDYLFTQGQVTLDELTYVEDLSTVNIVHSLVPAIVKFSLTETERFLIESISLKASEEIFPTSVTIDGASATATAYADTITVTNDIDADALYALVFPTTFADASVEVVVTIAGVEYTVGSISTITAFESNNAYVIPVDASAVAACKITYDLNYEGAPTAYYAESIYVGQEITYTADAVVDGDSAMIFVGWYDSATPGSDDEEYTTVEEAGTKTLYASWVTGAMVIDDYDDLLTFRTAVNAGNQTLCAVMTDNIDLNGSSDTPWTPIGTVVDTTTTYVKYAGVFDGGGKTITGLYVTGTAAGVGLFYGIEEGTIQNLTIVDPFVSSTSNAVGAFSGYAYAPDGDEINTFKNCTVSGGSVTATYQVGGLVGSAGNLTMINCHNKGTAVTKSGTGTGSGGVAGNVGKAAIFTNCTNSGSVDASSGGTYNGGIVGNAGSGSFTVKIKGCSNSGDITTGAASNGGIIGYVTNGEIENCWNSGDIKMGSANAQGGIVGTVITSCILKYCYNTGDLYQKADTYGGSSPSNIGGIVGAVSSANVAKLYACYNEGNVTASHTVGGIVGNYANTSSEIIACYNIGDITGKNNSSSATCPVGGIVGSGSGTSPLISCFSIGNVATAGTTVGGIAGASGASSYYCNYFLNGCGATYGSGSSSATTQYLGMDDLGFVGVDSVSEISIATLNAALSSEGYGEYSYKASSNSTVLYPVITGLESTTVW